MADIDTIDQAHARFVAQADQTVAAIRSLAKKLQAAAAGGDTTAREWNLDLREVALALQGEQQEVARLLQAMHDFVANNANQAIAATPPDQPQYVQPQYEQPQYEPVQEAPAQRSGGLLSRFMHGGFGRSMAQGAGIGIGFGVGESIIDDIF
jgi:hypothetical protein